MVDPELEGAVGAVTSRVVQVEMQADELGERVRQVEELMQSMREGGSPRGVEGMVTKDEFRSLKCRFQYLERVVPPDVQKALKFFQSRDDGGSEFITDEPMLEAHLGTQLEDLQRMLRKLSEELRREVANAFVAVRGVQRENSICSNKLEDLEKNQRELQQNRDNMLPKILEALDRHASAAEAVAKGDTPPKDFHVKGEFGDLLAKYSPYVNEANMTSAMNGIQQDIQDSIANLRQEVFTVLSAKADEIHLQAIESQVEMTQQGLNQTWAQVSVPENTTPAAAFSRKQLARCFSCDSVVQVSPRHTTLLQPPAGETSGVHAKWPSRHPFVDRRAQANAPVSQKDLSMNKKVSLPTLPKLN